MSSIIFFFSCSFFQTKCQLTTNYKAIQPFSTKKQCPIYSIYFASKLNIFKTVYSFHTNEKNKQELIKHLRRTVKCSILRLDGLKLI